MFHVWYITCSMFSTSVVLLMHILTLQLCDWLLLCCVRHSEVGIILCTITLLLILRLLRSIANVWDAIGGFVWIVLLPSELAVCSIYVGRWTLHPLAASDLITACLFDGDEESVDESFIRGGRLGEMQVY